MISPIPINFLEKFLFQANCEQHQCNVNVWNVYTVTGWLVTFLDYLQGVPQKMSHSWEPKKLVTSSCYEKTRVRAYGGRRKWRSNLILTENLEGTEGKNQGNNITIGAQIGNFIS